MVVIFVLAADPFSLVEGAERDAAIGAVVAAVVLLGLAALATLIVVAPGVGRDGRLKTPSRRSYRLARLLTALALAGSTAALVVIALAVRSGEMADVQQAASVAATPEGDTDQDPDGEPGEESAGDGGEAIPFTDSKAVYLHVTERGRLRAADAMGCTPEDFPEGPLFAVAVGGTYVEPTVVLRSPGDDSPCSMARVTMPPEEVFVLPG